MTKSEITNLITNFKKGEYYNEEQTNEIIKYIKNDVSDLKLKEIEEMKQIILDIKKYRKHINSISTISTTHAILKDIFFSNIVLFNTQFEKYYLINDPKKTVVEVEIPYNKY